MEIDKLIQDLEKGPSVKSPVTEYVNLHPEDQRDVYTLVYNQGIEKVEKICTDALAREKRIEIYVEEQYRDVLDPPLSYRLTDG